jgi:hypothetical protein
VFKNSFISIVNIFKQFIYFISLKIIQKEFEPCFEFQKPALIYFKSLCLVLSLNFKYMFPISKSFIFEKSPNLGLILTLIQKLFGKV